MEEALEHPYLAKLHDIADEPVCSTPFAFDLEHQMLTEEQMKDMIYKEALELNPTYAWWRYPREWWFWIIWTQIAQEDIK